MKKELRIAKITLDGYFNFGNILQSYALQKFLEQYTNHVVTIWHDAKMPTVLSWWQWTWKEPIKWILNWNKFRSKFYSGFFCMRMIREARIRMFSVERMNCLYMPGKIAEIASEFDYFIVGSDQVWNPNFSATEDFFLTFAPPEKRISYAASISAPSIPEKLRQRFADNIMEMHAVSLREQEGAELVEQLIGRKPAVHIDPTMLLSAEHWSALGRKPYWLKVNSYILTYFLGAKPVVIDRIAKDAGLEIINLLDQHSFDIYSTGVDEFIWLIEHASLVYTDSFHGTVFSILFRRPFVVCDRVGDGVESAMSSRIDTLLEMFHLSSRRARFDNGYRIFDPFHIDYSADINEIMLYERNRSNDYFRRAMNLMEDE